MDFTTVVGIIIGVGGVVIGNSLEGGTFGSLIQGTAFLIVFGGTFGAVLVANRWQDIRTGFSLLALTFRADDEGDKQELVREIRDAARIARKESVLGLEKRFKNMKSDYFKIILRYVIDGVDAKTIRDVFEAEIEHEEEKMVAGSKIWADAGGFAPTIGIIGAVLGLIHVMNHLSDTSQLGRGIAVAFVATIYGVGAANLIFLPIANKMKKKIQAIGDRKMIVLEGALGILSGMNPYIIDEKMRALAGVQHESIEDVL